MKVPGVWEAIKDTEVEVLDNSGSGVVLFRATNGTVATTQMALIVGNYLAEILKGEQRRVVSIDLCPVNMHPGQSSSGAAVVNLK